MSSEGSKKPEDSAVPQDMGKAIDRVKWLRSLAGQLTQEANELETKWGLADAGDAMNADAPADAGDDEAGVSDAADGKPAKTPVKEMSKKKKRKRDAEADVDPTEPEAVQPEDLSASDKISSDQAGPLPAGGRPKKAKKEKKDRKEKKDKTDMKFKKGKKQRLEKGVADTPREAQEAKINKNQKDKTKYNKKGKYAKGRDVAQDSDTAAKSPAVPTKAVDNWNVNALEGGAERQSKFMKLLGGGKAASSAGAQNSGEASSKKDIQRHQDDLQKQYDAGMRMKFEGQGQRRGLGA